MAGAEPPRGPPQLEERVREEDLALVDEPPAREAESEGPLDLHAALAQIQAPEEPLGSEPGDHEAAPPSGGPPSLWGAGEASEPGGWGEEGGAEDKVLEAAAALTALRAAQPPLPCESWFAVGGVHDLGSPLVRVANDDLQEAALRGDLGLVRRLIHAGASVNAPMRPECDDEFMSLLHVLALKPELPNGSRIIAEIIHRGANLNVRSSLGTTPLMSACLAKHVGAVEVLLEARADPTPLDDFGRTAGSCAVLSCESEDDADMLEQEEALAVDVVQLLASAGADLNGGGAEAPPIVYAVRRRSQKLVVALLEGGAVAEGLHAAVESGHVSIIRALVKAEANPFTKDAQGKKVMDLALERGDQEITTLLRNFEGDLQRQQHPHLKTLEEQMRLEALGGMETRSRNGDNGLGGARRSMEAPSPLKPMLSFEEDTFFSRARGKLQVLCRRLNRTRAFQVVMFSCLLAALFLPDLWILLDISTNAVLDVFLCIILVAFLTEFLVQVIGLSKSYTCTFFFWMDLVGVLSVPLDHSLVTNALPGGFDNAVVMRAARMAKLGARAGRFTKLVKLLRFLPGFQDQGSAGTAKVITGKLNMALSTRVSSLIIIMVMILPLFELLTYPEADFSMRMWAEELGDVARGSSPEALAGVLADVQAFYAERSHFPFMAHYTLANGSALSRRLSQEAPGRRRSRVQISDASSGASLEFSFKSPQQIDALCNCLLITTIVVLMVASSLVLMNSVSSIVLVPLELLLSNVQKVASKIFSSVSSMSGKAGREDDNEKDEANEEDGAGFGNETQVLERVLKKLATLSEINTQKTPLDAEAFSKLNGTERALLQGYSTGPAADERGQPGAGPEARAEQERLLEEMDKTLLDAGISWEDFDSWDFDVLDIGQSTRLSVCNGILAYHHGGAGYSSPHAAEWTSACAGFVEGAALGYRDPREAPYHNWAHAVDTAFTLFRLFSVCQAENFFSAQERFAMVVGAICHDIGHPGLNNAFLVETSHELAIRYNDQSPLENMHCAKLFELARQPTSAVFAGLSHSQYLDVRRVCIGAVLHTDYQRHFALVKETQALYEMNAEIFDVTEEMYRTSCMHFPSQEVAEFFCTPDVKTHLQHVLLHYCDVSNPMKARPLCEAWADKVLEEFFLQGDRERAAGLPVQPLNDRTKVNKAYSQVAFIEYFVAPMAFAMSRLLPPLDCLAETMLENIELWFDSWAEETQPPPDPEEKARVRERIAKLLAKWPRQAS